MKDSSNPQIIMYTTSWCPDCIRAKAVMRKLKVDYINVDVDKDREGYQIVLDYNGGKRVVPTIVFPDNTILVEPSNKALAEKLIGLGLVKES